MFSKAIHFPMRPSSNWALRCFTIFAILLFSRGAVAAQDGIVDPTFDISLTLGSNNRDVNPERARFISAFAFQKDGKTLVGGRFEALGGKSRISLARLNADGTADASFNCRLAKDAIVRRIVQDNQGRILILGSFDHVGGIPRPGFARLRADGSLDTAFNPPTRVQGFFLNQLDQVFVWGTTISDGATQKRGIFRLFPDGSIDPGFNVSFNPEDSIRKAAPDPAGRIVILGDLRISPGNVQPKLIRLLSDGTLDTAFAAISLKFPTPDYQGFGFVLDTFGRALIAPDFTPSNRLTRLNLNGSIDSGFNAPAVSFSAIDFDPSGRIITPQGQPNRSTYWRLNQNGTRDTSFLAPDFEGDLDAFAVDSIGRIVFGGKYIRPLDNNPDFLAFDLGRLSENGLLDGTFRESALRNGDPQTLVTDSSGRTIVGGYFTHCGTRRVHSLARISNTGDVDPLFHPLPFLDPNRSLSSVNALAIDSSNRILVCGSFTRIGGGNRRNIARLNPDGTLDPTFDAGSAAGTLTRIVVAPSGKIYVSGVFETFNGVPRPSLVRLNQDGSVDTGFQPALGSYRFALDSQGRIIVVRTNGVARLNPDGSRDASFDIQFPDFTSDVFVAGNDRVLVTSDLFESEILTARLYRYNPDGSLDTTFSSSLPPQARLLTAAVNSGGQILTSFRTNGVTQKRLNSDGSPDTSFQTSSIGNSISAYAFDGNGRTICGGQFSNYDGIPRFGLVRLKTDSCSDAVAPASVEAPSSGTTGMLTFSFPNAACSRRIESAFPWISAFQSATGTVSFSIAPNDGGSRTGYIRINERLVTVTQQSGCSYGLDPNTVNVGDLGGTGAFTITCGTDCAWEAVPDSPWIILTGPSRGRGNGTVQYQVLGNPGRTRNGTITVNDQRILITQKQRRVPTAGAYRPSDGFVFLRNSNSTGNADTEFFYGQAADIPLSGDWDGDGGDSVGIYRNGVFYLKNANVAGFADIQFAYGQPGDIPIAGDWDGDGIDTIGVIRGNRVLLRNSNTAGPADIDFNYGTDTDIFIAGDWNGDGIDTIGAYRQSNGFVYLRNSNTSGFADTEFFYGLAGDRPIAGDWDGDGIDTIGVVRGNRWLLRNSNTSGFADIDFNFGADTDIPIVGDWNGAP